MHWSRRRWLIGAPALVLGALRPGRASGGAEGAAAVVGSYRFAGGQQQTDELLRRIDMLVDEMNFFVRPIARRRMRHANQVPLTVDISEVGAKLRVDLPGLRPIISAPDGRTFIWRDQYGEDVRVRQRLAGRTLNQHFRGKGGSRDIAYVVTPDGQRLSFGVKISSRQLPYPLRYRLSFRRVA